MLHYVFNDHCLRSLKMITKYDSLSARINDLEITAAAAVAIAIIVKRRNIKKIWKK